VAFAYLVAPAEGGPVEDGSPTGECRLPVAAEAAQAGRAEASMAAVLENLSEAVVVVDARGNVVLRNRAARQLAGVEPGEPENPLDGTILSVGHLDGTAVGSMDFPARRLLRGLVVRNEEYLVVRKDGSRFRVLANGTTVKEDGEVTFAVVMYRDVTETRLLEELKEDYVRALSHDLRSPLTMLIAQGQMLSRELEKKGLRCESRQTDDILRTAERMNLMIEDLSESMRLESGQFRIHKEPLDACAVVRDVVSRARIVSSSNLIIDVPDVPAMIVADGPRVERCIINLLSNAVKYSPAGSAIRVSLSFDRAQVHITVSDNGPGIDPEDLPHIFQRFYRGKAGTGSDGLGLGLYVSRLTAEAHGGTIGVKSVPGQGSTFTLALPAR